MLEIVHYDGESSSTPQEVSKNCDLIINAKAPLRYNLNYFSDVFSADEIKKDKSHIESKKLNFKNQEANQDIKSAEKMVHSKKRSEALEIIIADQIELSDWFGGNSLFFRTTEYDDIINGTDAVVEFNIEDQPKRIALAIDSTSRTDLPHVQEKINRNISKILNNNLEIKYFESQIDGFKGLITGIIPVVIGLEAENTNELIDKFAQLIKLKQTEKNPSTSENEKMQARQSSTRCKKEIEKHPAQLIFLREIKLQLEMYRKIIASENNENIFVKESDIQDITQIITDTLNEKKQIKESSQMLTLKNDAVYNLISYVSKQKINS